MNPYTASQVVPRKPAASWRFATGLFVLCGLTSIAAATTVLGALTIGIFVLPFAAALFVLTVWLFNQRSVCTHALAGVLLAPAFALAVVATWINAAIDPNKMYCDSSGSCGSAGPDYPQSWSVPMIIAAAAMVVLAVVVFVGWGKVLRSRPVRTPWQPTPRTS